MVITVSIIIAIATAIAILMGSGAVSYGIIKIAQNPDVQKVIPRTTYSIAATIFIVGLGIAAYLTIKALRRKGWLK